MFARVLALAAAALIGAAASAQTPPPPLPAMSADDGYLLGVDDEIEVKVYGQDEQAQVTRTRIKEDGTITLPLLGTITVRDRTARQVAAAVTQELRAGGYFTDPVVNVDVTQYVSNAVTVYGAVGASGVYPLDRAQTVAMMLARAGGARGDGADYVILRRAEDPTEHRILLSSFQGDFSSMTRLRAGDTLFVPAAPVIFVYGQVNSPGSFPIKSGMTIRQALARAGGPTLAGSERNISIYRDGERLRKVDLNSIAKEGDTLFIHERLF